MSYATPQEFLDRYDTNRLGELVKDDGSRATPTQLLTDSILQAVLDDGAADILAACRVGERYSDDDLTGLVDPDRLLLVRLNVDLAYGLLLQRRGYPADQVSNLAPGVTKAEQMLEAIREGERIFNLTDQADAGSAIEVIGTDRWPSNAHGVYRTVREAERYFGDLSKPNTPEGP